MGNVIELIHPFPEAALPRVWRWVEASRDRVADDFFVKTLDDFIAEWDRLAARGRMSWAVASDGHIGGVITAERTGGIAFDLHCVFSRDFYGHQSTVQALDLVIDQIFTPAPNGCGAEKISTMAFADNLSLSGIVRKLGGTREGLQHGQTRRGGVLVDVVLL